MSAITNASQSGLGGLEDSVGAYQRNKMCISSSIFHQFWFRRFMEGVHKRVGEERRQDEAITIDSMIEIQRLCEDDWRMISDRDLNRKKSVREMAAWFLLDFCASLR